MRNCKKIKNNWVGIGTLARVDAVSMSKVNVVIRGPSPTRRALRPTPRPATGYTVNADVVKNITSAATARQMCFVAKFDYIVI